MTTDLAPANRAVLDGYLAVLDGLETIGHDVGEDHWDTATGCPGWSVRDVLSHCVGLESILAGDPIPDHEVPEDLPHVRNEAGRFMEVHVDARRGVPVRELLAEIRDVFARRRRQLTGYADEDWEARRDFLFGPARTRSALRIRVFDLWAHEQDLRRALDRPGGLDGPASELGLEQIRRGLVATLPDALADRDEVLAVEVVDRPEGSFAIGLGGERPDPDARPDAVLRVPLADLVALACGRSDAPRPAELDVSGDAELAREAASSFGFTP